MKHEIKTVIHVGWQELNSVVLTESEEYHVIDWPEQLADAMKAHNIEVFVDGAKIHSWSWVENLLFVPLK